MEQKMVGFYRTSEFSFSNFVGVRLDSDINLSERIQNLGKQSPLISGMYVHSCVCYMT